MYVLISIGFECMIFFVKKYIIIQIYFYLQIMFFFLIKEIYICLFIRAGKPVWCSTVK